MKKPFSDNRGYITWSMSKIGVIFSVLIMVMLLYLIYKYITCVNASDAANQYSTNFAAAIYDTYSAPAGFQTIYPLKNNLSGKAYELSIVNNTKKGVITKVSGTRCGLTMGGAVVNVPFKKYPEPVKNFSDNATYVIIKNEGDGVSINLRSECCGCIVVALMHEDAGGPRVDDADMLNDEYVIFQNKCGKTCDLSHWTVTDLVISRPRYEFKNYILDADSIVILHSGDGINTQLNQYWNSTFKPNPAIWNNDADTLFLRDEWDILCLEYNYKK